MLGNGQEVSWMNIGDEGSGAHLNIEVYDKRTVAEIDAKLATQKINESFERWGLPIEIKIDNGHPFVNPNGRDSPTKTILWWIGLGIRVRQNTPGRPQENGIVECLQGTMCTWSNPKGQATIKALQRRLMEESDFQRNYYQIPSRNYKTRLELYPELETNERKYDPKNFKMQRVYDFLSKKVFKRTITTNGLVKFLGGNIYVGNKYFGMPVTITFDPIDKHWMVRKENGTLLKTSTKEVPCEKEIRGFSIVTK